MPLQYIPDVKKKQSVAWAAVREAADIFLRPFYDSLQVCVLCVASDVLMRSAAPVGLRRSSLFLRMCRLWDRNDLGGSDTIQLELDFKFGSLVLAYQ